MTEPRNLEDNVAAADALMKIFAMSRQETYYALCDAVWEMGLAESQDEAKRMCIEGAIRSTGHRSATHGGRFAGLTR